MALVRLQKLLSERGVASRRKAEELIEGGHDTPPKYVFNIKYMRLPNFDSQKREAHIQSPEVI